MTYYEVRDETECSFVNKDMNAEFPFSGSAPRPTRANEKTACTDSKK